MGAATATANDGFSLEEGLRRVAAIVKRRGIKVQVKNNRKALRHEYEKDFTTSTWQAKRRARRAAGQYGLMEDERDPHDNYETPPDAVHMLWGHQKFLDGRVFDPSCGRGLILKAVKEADPSRVVIGHELHRARLASGVPKRDVHYGKDFFTLTQVPLGVRYLIFNPPYSKADEHVRHALSLTPSNGLCCALLRLTWMAAKKRADLLPFLHKIVICGRLNMLPPDVEDKGHSGTVDFCWMVFAPKVVEGTSIVRAK